MENQSKIRHGSPHSYTMDGQGLERHGVDNLILPRIYGGHDHFMGVVGDMWVPVAHFAPPVGQDRMGQPPCPGGNACGRSRSGGAGCKNSPLHAGATDTPHKKLMAPATATLTLGMNPAPWTLIRTSSRTRWGWRHASKRNRG